MAPRAPRDGRARARPRGPDGDPASAAGRAAKLGPLGHTRLATLGVEDEHLPRVAAAVMQHPALGNTPDPPDEDELLALLRKRSSRNSSAPAVVCSACGDQVLVILVAGLAVPCTPALAATVRVDHEQDVTLVYRSGPG